MASKSKIEVYVHFTWTTKQRMPLIVRPWETLIHTKIHEAAEGLGCTPVVINGIEDHVHVLLALASTVTLARVVTRMKSISSLVAHDEGYAQFGWQRGYGAFSVDWRNQRPTIDYIRNQKRHHARGTVDHALEQFTMFDELA